MNLSNNLDNLNQSQKSLNLRGNLMSAKALNSQLARLNSRSGTQINDRIGDNRSATPRGANKNLHYTPMRDFSPISNGITNSVWKNKDLNLNHSLVSMEFENPIIDSKNSKSLQKE